MGYKVSLFAALFVGLSCQRAAHADILYASDELSDRIVTINTSTNAVNLVEHTPFGIDSLIFESATNILYSDNHSGGGVRQYNITTGIDSPVAGGFSTALDITLEPGGGSILVSDAIADTITRVNLSTFSKTLLGSYGGEPQGLTYDGSGRLFANIGGHVTQLDPVTGAILASSPAVSITDGLAWDSFTGNLFADINQDKICEYNPSNLAAGPIQCSAPVLSIPDGLESDGAGNLFLVNFGTHHLYEYNIADNSLTPGVFVSGLDDIAPLVGLGGQAPEPGSWVMMAIGAVVLAFGYRHRQSRD